MTNFNELGLAEPLLRAITEAGYDTPTPIQLKAIPSVLAGSDLLGLAQTGTGKTAAFALPILHRLAADRRPAMRKGCRVLVLSPTRELATQIAESFRTYGKHYGFSVATVFGGVSERPQAQALSRGVDIVVATPGRLLDHLGQRTAVLSGTEVLVLDEADQMLDLGFLKPIKRIVAHLPAKRQSLFFSATMPSEIEALTRELLHDPVRVAVAPVAKTVDRVEQRVIHIEKNKKKSLLVELLSDAAMSRTLVFTRTKRGADRVAKHLEGVGVRTAVIHGNKSQSQREHALEAFRSGRNRVLVATDIAARGIDIDEVSHVINFELPEVPEAYVHRIGRTARAGASGFAVAFCDGEERGLLRDIERLTRLSIPSQDRRKDASLAADRPAGSDRPPGGLNGRGGGRDHHGASGGRPAHTTGDRNHHGRGDGGRNGAGREGLRSRDERRGAGEGDRRDARNGDFRENDGRRDDRLYPAFGDAGGRPHGQREERADSNGHRNGSRNGHGGGKRHANGHGNGNGNGGGQRQRFAANGQPGGQRGSEHRAGGQTNGGRSSGDQRRERGNGEAPKLGRVSFMARESGRGGAEGRGKGSSHGGPGRRNERQVGDRGGSHRAGVHGKGGNGAHRQGGGRREGGRPRAE